MYEVKKGNKTVKIAPMTFDSHDEMKEWLDAYFEGEEGDYELTHLENVPESWLQTLEYDKEKKAHVKPIESENLFNALKILYEECDENEQTAFIQYIDYKGLYYATFDYQDFQDRYRGHWMSPESFAEDYAYDSGAIKEDETPSWILYHIDWEAVWKNELELSGWAAIRDDEEYCYNIFDFSY